jgi:hypothetical protein
MVAAKIGVLFLIAVALGLAVFFTRGWSGGSPGRRPGRRHWITRVICGTVGGAILLAFLVITLRDVRATSKSARPITLRVPTLPPPEAPKQRGEVKAGRFLLQMVVTRAGEFPGRPIASESYEVLWPRDQDRTFELYLKEGLGQLKLTETLRGIMWGMKNKLEFSGSTTFQANSPTSSHSQSGGSSFPYVMSVDGGGHERSLFSLVKVVDEDLLVLCDLTWVRGEDPLRPGSLEDWIALRGRESWEDDRERGRVRHSQGQEFGSPVEALVRQLGVNFLPALAAALLLAQLFRRRSLGFVQVTAGIILFLGALDRVALHLNESQARNPSAPLEARMRACSQLRTTVYFRKSALEDLRALAGDATAPKPLQAQAARLIEAEK